MSSGKSKAHRVALMESEKISSSDLFQSPVPGGWRTKRFDCHSLQEEAHSPICLSFSPCGMGSTTTSEGAEMSLSGWTWMSVVSQPLLCHPHSLERPDRDQERAKQLGPSLQRQAQRIQAIPLNIYSSVSKEFDSPYLVWFNG